MSIHLNIHSLCYGFYPLIFVDICLNYLQVFFLTKGDGDNNGSNNGDDHDNGGDDYQGDDGDGLTIIYKKSDRIIKRF